MPDESRSRRHYVFTNLPEPVPEQPRDPLILLTLALRDDGLAEELSRGREVEVEGLAYRVVANVVVP